VVLLLPPELMLLLGLRHAHQLPGKLELLLVARQPCS
jgi:hypothetical protein